MADPMGFEARLAEALDRYAERIPAHPDVAGIVRIAARGETRSETGTGNGRVARPTWPVSPPKLGWLRVGLVVALLALAATLVALIGQKPTEPLDGGRLMVTVGTTAWVFDPSLQLLAQVRVGPRCTTTLVDGGAQLVTTQRFQPTRKRPLGADPSADVGFVSTSVPGYGGSNMERWSPDLTRYAVIRWARQNDNEPKDGVGAILVVSIHGTSEPSRATFEVRGLQSATWSPDGTRIAVTRWAGDRAELVEVDVVRGAQRVIGSYRPSVGDLYLDAAWTGGGSKIAVQVGTDDGDRAALVDVASGDVVVLPAATTVPGGLTFPEWSPDGRRGLVREADLGLTLVAADGTRLTDLGDGDPVTNPTLVGWAGWAADGRHLAVVDPSGAVVRVIDEDGRQVGLLPLRSVSGGDGKAAWSADGRSIAVASVAGGAFALTVYDAESLAIQATRTVPVGSSATGADTCFQWVPPVD